MERRYGRIISILEGTAQGFDLFANMRESKSMGLSDWIKAVKTGGKWDYKNNSVFQNSNIAPSLLDEFGNFHFGVVAAAFGFDLDTAVFGAGQNQYIRQGGGNISDGILALTSAWAISHSTSRTRREIIGGFTFGDNVGDSIPIMYGWDYYHISTSDTFWK